MRDKGRKPTLVDYLAGGVLANGFVWVWFKILGSMGESPSRLYLSLLSLTTIAIFLVSALVASYQVCRRSSSGQLIVGLKVSILAWLLSPFIILSAVEGPILGLATILLVCFSLGGVAGAYLATRARLRGFRTPIGDFKLGKEDF